MKDRLVPIEEALEIARREGHWQRFPPAVLQAMARSRDGTFSLSASSGGGCYRQRLLKALEDYALDPENEWRPLEGTGVHAALETGEPHDEMMLSMDIEVPVPLDGGGVEFVTLPLRGRIDTYDAEHQRITDYKTTGWFRRKDFKTGKMITKELPEATHILQLNIYALLLRSNGYPVTQGQIWYVKVGSNKPPRQMHRVEIWHPDDTIVVVQELAQPLARAYLTRRLPPPIPEDDPRHYLCRFCPVLDACNARWEREIHGGDRSAGELPPELYERPDDDPTPNESETEPPDDGDA